jgi:hypothetical protein
MRLRICLVLALLLCGQAAYSQTASDAAAKYFNAIKKKDYEAAAAMFYPPALTEFRTMMSFVNEFPEDEREGIYGTFFGPAATKETVTKLSDAQFFAAFLTAVMSQAEDQAQGELQLGDIQVLGEVAEGAKVRHVVTRSKMKAGALVVESMEVVSFTNNNGVWQAMLSGQMKGLPQQLRAAFGR